MTYLTRQGLADLKTPNRLDINVAKLELKGLTPVEGEILWLTSQGETNYGIARRLGLEVYQVKRLLTYMFRILQVGSRAQMVYEAIKEGILK